MHQIRIKKSFPFRGQQTKVGGRMDVDHKVFDYLMSKWGTEYIEVVSGKNQHQEAAEMKKSEEE